MISEADFRRRPMETADEVVLKMSASRQTFGRVDVTACEVISPFWYLFLKRRDI